MVRPDEAGPPTKCKNEKRTDWEVRQEWGKERERDREGKRNETKQFVATNKEVSDKDKTRHHPLPFSLPFPFLCLGLKLHDDERVTETKGFNHFPNANQHIAVPSPLPFLSRTLILTLTLRSSAIPTTVKHSPILAAAILRPRQDQMVPQE